MHPLLMRIQGIRMSKALRAVPGIERKARNCEVLLSEAMFVVVVVFSAPCKRQRDCRVGRGLE